ncbi:DUF2842 domain-containing protein [Hyphomonas sp.]|uniref:DUF2842 domain-containing protein n=1 Tax=Hyphomonas sp. TaxID=87 RepID=UPI003D2B898B|tara:strand:+ start:2004 stop:2210 length:207 start_codon:yes stop_codon:yes gene_type:complete
MRKPVASLILLVFIVLYIVLVGTFSGMIETWPRWAQLVFYVIAGFAWILPLKPLFAWMNDGTPQDSDD